MKTFKRMPFFYWGDRIFILVLLCGLGALLLVATYTMIAQGRTNLGPLPVLGPLVGGAMIPLGIWVFFRPYPTRVEIDAKEVRVFHRPTKTVVIPRKDVICGKTVSSHLGASGVGILYRDAKGKRRGVKLYGGWRDDNGRYVRNIANAFNDVLGLKEEKTRWY